MTTLFGVPIDVLVVVLALAFAAMVGSLVALGLRNPILLRLGLRKIPRSWGRSALIVAGLMLATTIIAAALSTGDTMAHTFRQTAQLSLGHIDQTVASARGQVGMQQGLADTYFDEAIFDDITAQTAALEVVDGVAPAILGTVAVQNLDSLRSEPRTGLFAAAPEHMEGFGEIRTLDGQVVDLGALGPGELYLNADGAEDLGAEAGHELLVLAGAAQQTFRVAAVVDYEGSGTDGAAVLMPLAAAQELLGVPGQVSHVLISNAGGPLEGARHTETVEAAITSTLEGTGLKVHPVKQDAIDLADEIAISFTTFFATFGMFSIVAGILLIFLLFVMLAAERRPEMGIARAIGTQRSQVVRMFLYEGLAYDLVAAAVGALAGVGVAFVMVFVMAIAFGGGLGIDIEHDVRPQSLAVAFLLGVFLTFVTVALSAWRISSLNIVAAVRNLPERSVDGKGGRLWWLGAAVVFLGVVVTAASLSTGDYAAFSLGITLLAAGTVPVLRRIGVPDRAAFTLPGLALLAIMLLPSSVLELVLPDLAISYSAFVVAGVAVVLGATWVVMFNADLIVAAVMGTLGRLPAFAPVMKTAVSRPIANRFRTGATVAMFSLVVLTVVITSATTFVIARAIDDVDRFGGGFDLRATVMPTSPIEDFETAVAGTEGLDPAVFERIAPQSILASEARQLGTEQDFEAFPVFGFGDAFIGAAPYSLSTRAQGFDSDEAVWQAMQDDPGLAVITHFAVPAREALGIVGGGLPDFRLEGFYIEDESFEPVDVEVRDPQTGASTTVTVVGVLPIISPDQYLTGLVTSQQAMVDTFGDQARPIAYWIDLDDTADVETVAAALETGFFAHGMQVDVMQDVVDEVVAGNRTFTYLVQGFLGLGLVVGVAALAVITARSVVERQRDLAVLRSIGFQRGMIYLLVLVETSFIALIGILLGFLLGIVIAYDIIIDLAGQPAFPGVEFAMPWLNLVIIFVIVYVAAILTALLPARKAANVYPAEALRYD